MQALLKINFSGLFFLHVTDTNVGDISAFFKFIFNYFHFFQYPESYCFQMVLSLNIKFRHLFAVNYVDAFDYLIILLYICICQAKACISIKHTFRKHKSKKASAFYAC